jgi:hypothetical protein
VEVLKTEGEEGVVFSFFPGAGAEVGEDGKKISMKGAVIESNVAVRMETGLKIYNAYTGKYTMGVKPNRAWVGMKKGEVVVLRVGVE